MASPGCPAGSGLWPAVRRQNLEAIRKKIIEDPTWTSAAFRLAIYLAAKPDGWVLHVKPIADGTGLQTERRADRHPRAAPPRPGLRRASAIRRGPTRRGGRPDCAPGSGGGPDVYPPENAGVDVTSQNGADTSTPLENRGVDVTSQNGVSTPPENAGVDAFTPPENAGVDVTSPNGVSAQVGQPPDFSLPLGKIDPNREDEQGLKELREDLSAVANMARAGASPAAAERFKIITNRKISSSSFCCRSCGQRPPAHPARHRAGRPAPRCVQLPAPPQGHRGPV